jgi:hypothetical protein
MKSSVGADFPIGEYKNLGVLRAEERGEHVSGHVCGCYCIKELSRFPKNCYWINR